MTGFASTREPADGQEAGRTVIHAATVLGPHPPPACGCGGAGVRARLDRISSVHE